MGTLSQHWTFFERLKWMFFGEAPKRDVLKSELERLRREAIETQLEIIDKQATLTAIHDKVTYLEEEMSR